MLTQIRLLLGLLCLIKILVNIEQMTELTFFLVIVALRISKKCSSIYYLSSRFADLFYPFCIASFTQYSKNEFEHILDYLGWVLLPALLGIILSNSNILLDISLFFDFVSPLICLINRFGRFCPI